jgi:hypothetical protein
MPGSKGTNLIELVKILRSRRAEAQERVPPALRRYLDERVMESKWYPEADVLELTRVLAGMLPSPDGQDVYAMLGVFNARNHVEGVYAHLLSDAEPMQLPIRLGALWESLHDTGRLRVRTLATGRAHAELENYGYPSREMCRMVGGYVGEAYRMAGVSDPRVAEEQCTLDGAGSCTWTITWE